MLTWKSKKKRRKARKTGKARIFLCAVPFQRLFTFGQPFVFYPDQRRLDLTQNFLCNISIEEESRSITVEKKGDTPLARFTSNTRSRKAPFFLRVKCTDSNCRLSFCIVFLFAFFILTLCLLFEFNQTKLLLQVFFSLAFRHFFSAVNLTESFPLF